MVNEEDFANLCYSGELGEVSEAVSRLHRSRTRDLQRGRWGWLTPLMCAALRSDDAVEIVEVLISAGASSDECNDRGFAPVHMASVMWNVSVLQALLRAGSRVQGYRVSPLLLACTNDIQRSPPQSKGVVTVKTLLSAGVDVYERTNITNASVFHVCASRKQREMFDAVSSSIDVSVGAELIESRNAMRRTPLMVTESSETARALIDYGADVNAVCQIPYGTATAAECVAANDGDALVAFLEVGYEGDWTSIFTAAVGGGNLDTLRKLYEVGLVDRAALSSGLARVAASHVVPAAGAVVRELVILGAEVNAFVDCKTPLMIAAEMANLKVVQALIECGASPEIKDQDGRRAIDMIIPGIDEEMMQKLLGPG